jgi:hypothetical protein
MAIDFGRCFSSVKVKVDDLVKNKIFPPLLEGMKERGIDKALGFLNSSLSPRPAPIEGEGGILDLLGFQQGSNNKILKTLPSIRNSREDVNRKKGFSCFPFAQ